MARIMVVFQGFVRHPFGDLLPVVIDMRVVAAMLRAEALGEQQVERRQQNRIRAGVRQHETDEVERPAPPPGRQQLHRRRARA